MKNKIIYHLIIFCFYFLTLSCEKITLTEPVFNNVFLENTQKPDTATLKITETTRPEIRFSLSDPNGLKEYWICIFFVSTQRDPGYEDMRLCQLFSLEKQTEVNVAHREINLSQISPPLTPGLYHFVLFGKNQQQRETEYHIPFLLEN